ncbi:hypothetical protein [Nocardia sp. NBC_00511]|uniref:DUF7373 family lipoprotein n=1 Tax=Nocardia sp. NBC_00511 TaxID=2903591 RepID=UPI0030E305D0
MRRCRTLVLLRASLAAVLLLGATGCVVRGHSVPQYPDPQALDVGKYSSRPLDEPPGNDKYGRVVEAARLAEALIDPTEADAALQYSVASDGVYLLSTPAKATLLLAAPVRAVLDREGMVTGAAVGGTDVDPGYSGPVTGASRVLSMMVLRFPDAAAAARAATAIDAADAAVNPDNVSVAIPGYPAAHAHWRPSVPTLAATVADGVYVLSSIAGHTSTDVAALTGLVRKGFDAQLPRLRDFVPTPADRVASLSLDREGMLRRLVPEAPGRWPYPKVIVNVPQRDAVWTSVIRAEGVVFGPRAARLWNGHSAADPPIELEAVNGATQLLRMPTSAAARHALEKFDTRRSTGSTRPVSGPQGVPDALCAEHTSIPEGEPSRFLCEVIYGKYLARMQGSQLHNLQQRLTAQYGLLVNGDS